MKRIAYLALSLATMPAVAQTTRIPDVDGHDYYLTHIGTHQTGRGIADRYRVHLVEDGTDTRGDWIECEIGGREVNCATGEEPR